MIHKIHPESILPNTPDIQEKTPKSSGFKETLKEFISDVNDMQQEADETANAFLRGEITDLHQVTLAVEKARVSLELLLEIRNKMMESYQEIMRMQV